MAEAEARGFFCHKCNVEIAPQLPDYVCPLCQNGFIEILAEPRDSDSDSSSDIDMDSFDYFDILQDQNAAARSAESSSSAASNGPRRNQRLRHLNTRHIRRSPFYRVSIDRQTALTPILQELITHMASGVLGDNLERMEIPMLMTSNLASNPGDYAWGRGGLDAIITQLLNQLDGTGPPPLAPDKIAQIPFVKITQSQCDINLQCSVCMEDFQLDESVRQLNCEHCYHNDCIIPWLELHGTCPVCRKSLMDPRGVNTRYAQQGERTLADRAPSSTSSNSDSTTPSNSDNSTSSSNSSDSSTRGVFSGPSTSRQQVSSEFLLFEEELD